MIQANYSGSLDKTAKKPISFEKRADLVASG
jgi:hypothetical protein